MTAARGAGPSDIVLALLAAVAFVACLLLPISNPDIFWHLSAARRMAQSRAIPAADWLSSTLSGSPWTDFEWLDQLMFGLLHRAGGMAALWIFKMLLLAGVAAALWAALSLYKAPRSCRAAALALWSAAFLARSDIRPDLFSVAAFGLTLLALEARRLGARDVPTRRAIPFFCLWANLHAGFVYGLMLIACYAVGESLDSLRLRIRNSLGRRFPSSLRKGKWEIPHSQNAHDALWWKLAGAFAGSLIQPLGLRAYGVLWSHWTGMKSMSAVVAEWGEIRIGNPWHWPAWALLFAGLACATIYIRRRRSYSSGPLLAFICCGSFACVHARLGGYFAMLALPLSIHWLMEAGILTEAEDPKPRWGPTGLCALCAAYVLWWGGRFGLFARVFDDRFVPVRASGFLARERQALAGRTLYNPFGWGGYLGWVLYPDYRVFQDGRYIFNPLLEENMRAVADTASWAGFMDRHHVEVALLEDIPMMLPTAKRYPDGSEKAFERPYYVLYMPKERWALVHWDEKALVFVRRAAVAADWLASREYRYARPFDDDALNEALRLGEAPEAAVKAEFRRHGLEAAAQARPAPPL